MKTRELVIIIILVAVIAVAVSLEVAAIRLLRQKNDIIESYQARLEYKNAMLARHNSEPLSRQLPRRTVPMTIEQAGALKDSTELLIMHIHPDYKQWLLDTLGRNGGVERIYDATTPASIGGTGQDCEYHVTLTPRIGKNDWDKLFALPDELLATATVYGPYGYIYLRYQPTCAEEDKGEEYEWEN